MAIKNKKRHSKYDFSDEEIQNEIKDEIREIREMNLNELEESRKIMKLYEEKKN